MAQAVAEGAGTLNGTETILFVEDDTAARQLASITLESLGYTVLAASDGMKAAEIFQENRGSAVDLLLTDLRIPGLDGRTLARMLSVEVSNLRVLYITGYQQISSEIRDGPAETGALLHKPFTPDALARAVRSALDANDQSSAA